MFKRLSKVELEHAELISEALGIENPKIEFSDTGCFEQSPENIEDAKKREERATALYAKAVKEATEPRVKEIFTALSEVEADHLEILTKKSALVELIKIRFYFNLVLNLCTVIIFS